jgi:hypothetical protein
MSSFQRFVSARIRCVGRKGLQVAALCGRQTTAISSSRQRRFRTSLPEYCSSSVADAVSELEARVVSLEVFGGLREGDAFAS